jgi:hypothetical protein
MTNLLKFGEPNAKLKKLAKKLKLKLKTFSLPAGWTCPGAKDCLSRADRTTGKIEDGPDTLFRCFAASGEAVYPSLRKMVWHNFELIDLHGWKEAVVVYSEEEAAEKGLDIDHDDEHAAFGKDDFALLIHGTQPKGSMASQALQVIKRANKLAATA